MEALSKDMPKSQKKGTKGVNVLVRNEPKRTERSSMVRTFIPTVLSMTVVMLHGNSHPQVGLEQELLTGQIQRNFLVCLNHSHAFVSRVFSVKEKESL